MVTHVVHKAIVHICTTAYAQWAHIIETWTIGICTSVLHMIKYIFFGVLLVSLLDPLRSLTFTRMCQETYSDIGQVSPQPDCSS